VTRRTTSTFSSDIARPVSLVTHCAGLRVQR
jgi:hypothetical protein